MSNINNSKLQELLDKQAITEVLHQYCRGADRCDEELMMSCYHPDATDQHNFFSGNGREFCKHAVRKNFEQKVSYIAKAVLQASAEGIGIYLKAGFKPLGDVHVFENRSLL